MSLLNDDVNKMTKKNLKISNVILKAINLHYTHQYGNCSDCSRLPHLTRSETILTMIFIFSSLSIY